MRLIGRLPLFQRALARVGHGQGARDHQHLGQWTILGREQHAADARVDRQRGKLAAPRREPVSRGPAQRGCAPANRRLRPTRDFRLFGDRGRRPRREPPLCIDRSQLLEQLVSIGNRARARAFDKWKRVDRGQIQRGHAQDDGSQRRAQDFRLGVLGARGIILGVVQAHADPGRDAAAAAGALIGRRLRDLLDLQLRHLVAQRIALDAGQPRVDHVAYARDRQRSLRDVGREDDAAAGAAAEHLLLLVGRQPCVQRQDLDRSRVRPAGKALGQQFGRLADLALARQEHQDVAGTFAPQVLGRGDDRLFELLLVVGLIGRPASERAIAHFDRVVAARDLEHRGRLSAGAEMGGEALCVQRRRSDDQLEIGPLRQELLQIAEQEIDVEAALVRLVDDDRVVGGERPVALRLGEQDAVGHQLDVGVGTGMVGEADLVPDHGAQLGAELEGDARGDAAGGNAPRLRMADQAANAAAGVEADFRDLRRLAGSGLAADDDDLVLANRRGDATAFRGDGEIRWVGDRRARFGALRDLRARGVDRVFDTLPVGRGRASLEPVDPAAERNRVARHAGAKSPAKIGDRPG